MRRTLILIASVLVSALFLWLALRGVPLEDVAQSIRQADVAWIVVGLLTTTAGLWTRAVRWRGLLNFKMPLLQAGHVSNVTYLVNLLPLRAGEVARSLLATRSGVPFMTAATSILVERVLDTLLVVIVLAIALSRAPQVPALATQAATLFGITSLSAFVLLLFFARYPHAAHRLLDWTQKALPPLERLPLRRLLDNVLDGLQPLTHWRGLLHAVGWTLISWTFSLITVYTLHRALGIEDVDLWLSAALGVTLASFSIAIPVTVAALGPFELAIQVAGEAVNMNPVAATSLGFVFHGMAVLGYAIWGTIGLVALGVSLSDMLRARDVAPMEDTSQVGA